MCARRRVISSIFRLTPRRSTLPMRFTRRWVTAAAALSVDGAMVPLTKSLVSGQQIEILTARDGHPSRDWLNPNLGYLKTSSARAKVRRWLKQQDHEAHVTQGRRVLEREHRRLGLSEINIAELAKRFKMRRPEDLLAAVGRGDISPVRLGQALGPQLPLQAPSP